MVGEIREIKDLGIRASGISWNQGFKGGGCRNKRGQGFKIKDWDEEMEGTALESGLRKSEQSGFQGWQGNQEQSRIPRMAGCWNNWKSGDYRKSGKSGDCRKSGVGMAR